MKILYEMETPWPIDVENPDGFGGVVWSKRGDIPFVPVIGMEIDNGDGDLREVLNVYWCADKPGEVVVHFDDDVARELDYWQRGGWQYDGFPKAPANKRKS